MRSSNQNTQKFKISFSPEEVCDNQVVKIFIRDASGSMQGCASGVDEGQSRAINNLQKESNVSGNNILLILVTFSYGVDVSYVSLKPEGEPLMPILLMSSSVSGGSTPLWATCYNVCLATKELINSDVLNPSSVEIFSYSDGLDNSSGEIKKEDYLAVQKELVDLGVVFEDIHLTSSSYTEAHAAKQRDGSLGRTTSIPADCLRAVSEQIELTVSGQNLQ